MISTQQAWGIYNIANLVLGPIFSVAVFAAVFLTIWAIVCKNKDRRRQLLRRAAISFLAAVLLMGSHLSSLFIFFVGGKPTFVAMALFVAVVASAVIGLSASILGLVYASFWTTERPRRQLAIRSLIGLLGFGTALVSPSVGMLVQHAVRAAVNLERANRPGTLTQLGNPAPDFTISDTDGSSFRLADCRGKVVLLNFFATWCGPCQMELPYLQAIWKESENDSEFRMLVIGREETDETVKVFKREHPFTFPMAADPHRLIYGEFASQSIPRTYLIARDGTIIYQATGFDEEEIAKLKALLHEELAGKG